MEECKIEPRGGGISQRAPGHCLLDYDHEAEWRRRKGEDQDHEES